MRLTAVVRQKKILQLFKFGIYLTIVKIIVVDSKLGKMFLHGCSPIRRWQASIHFELPPHVTTCSFRKAQVAKYPKEPFGMTFIKLVLREFFVSTMWRMSFFLIIENWEVAVVIILQGKGRWKYDSCCHVWTYRDCTLHIFPSMPPCTSQLHSNPSLFISVCSYHFIWHSEGGRIPPVSSPSRQYATVCVCERETVGYGVG